MLIVSPSQAEYMAQIRGLDRERCLVVPVDVGKWSAMALISDHCHEVVVAPFGFDLTESGVAKLLMIADEYAARLDAGSVRFGVEAAGHYHRGLVTALDAAGRDVVELNPAIVKDARGRIGQRRVKTDVQDCLAMAEVLIDGLGHTPTQRSVAMATQAAWAGQRRRKVEARRVLVSQLHAQIDLAFAGLTGCYRSAIVTGHSETHLRSGSDHPTRTETAPCLCRQPRRSNVGTQSGPSRRGRPPSVTSAGRSTQRSDRHGCP